MYICIHMCVYIYVSTYKYIYIYIYIVTLCKVFIPEREYILRTCDVGAVWH